VGGAQQRLQVGLDAEQLMPAEVGEPAGEEHPGAEQAEPVAGGCPLAGPPACRAWASTQAAVATNPPYSTPWAG
jgi:hypothetical protein